MKDTQNKKGMLSKVVALGAVVALTASQAQAALTAPDFTAAQTDVTTVVAALLGFMAIIYGFRKVLSLMGR